MPRRLVSIILSFGGKMWVWACCRRGSVRVDGGLGGDPLGIWQQFQDTQGQTFYHNQLTGASQWDAPPGWVADVTAAAGGDALDAVPAASQPPPDPPMEPFEICVGSRKRLISHDSSPLATPRTPEVQISSSWGALLEPGATPRTRPLDGDARRYASAGGEQPWTSFHFDNAAVTVNVALSDDAALAGGGKLLGVYGGAVHPIDRAEGEATVHSSSLLHGVSRMRGGVRYSLIVFYRAAPAGTETESTLFGN